MIEKTIENFILNACYFDVLDYRKKGKTPVVASYEKDQWSYIVEIMLITIKSLKPSLQKDGNVIDYKRFKNELELWKSYRHGMNRNLLYSLNKERYSAYDDVDESAYARASIITLANQRWETIKDELIKNILFTTANVELILECLLLSKILYLKLGNDKIEYDDILTALKQVIIDISPDEIDIDRKDYKIEFERMRVNLITLLNGINMDSKFPLLKAMLELLKTEKNGQDDYSNFFISGMLGILKGQANGEEIKDLKFIKNLCSYIAKLRKGRITLEDLKLEDYESVDIFSYKKGESFQHPLINFSEVIHKENKSNFEISYIRTKTGVYRFIKADKK